MTTEFHEDPRLVDWRAISEKKDCVTIEIEESLDIENAKIRFLGKDREPLIEMKVTNRNINICMNIGNPTFVELHTKSGVSVRYIEGSGKEFYKNN
jgi:hypothetical protein